MTRLPRRVDLLLVGVGNVGRRLLELLCRKRAELEAKYGLAFVLVGAADTSGAAVCRSGLELNRLLELKAAGDGVAGYPDCGRPGLSALEMVQTTSAQMFLDASPGNLRDGQPGLGCVEAALSGGLHVVTANKAPLALAFRRLDALARAQGVALRFSATVTGGLPSVNIGKRDLGIARIERLEAVLNLTSHHILARMEQEGLPYALALAEAQALGHAERDPSLDVQGWDAAEKLVILANSVLGFPARLEDVAVRGITEVSVEMLREAVATGYRIRPLATAEAHDGVYRLQVAPESLPADHPLARLRPAEMSIVYHTDVCGVISATILEETPQPTAAAMLRDMVDIYSSLVPESTPPAKVR